MALQRSKIANCGPEDKLVEYLYKTTHTEVDQNSLNKPRKVK